MKTRMNVSALCCVLGAAILLSACGGGGSSAGSSDGTAAAAATDPIDKWVGAYAGQCAQAWGVTDTANGGVVYWKRGLSYRKVSATKASGTIQIDYYTSSNCSSTSKYTLTVAGADTYMTVDGTVTLDGKTVDKLTFSEGVYFPGVSFGASFTVNGLKFTGDPYDRQAPQADKDLGYIDDAGKLYGGDMTQPLDAQGYPSALSSTPSSIVKTN